MADTEKTDSTKVLVLLARIEVKQNNMHDDITEIKSDVKEQRVEFNGRFRKLENWRSGIVAVGTFVLIVVGLLVRFL